MDKFCEDCIHNEVCQYGAIPPHIGRCNDKETLEDLKEKIETYKNAYRIMSDAFECEVTKNTRPKGKWIPVDERLPEERINPNTNDFEDVLCSTIWDDVRTYKYGKPIGYHKAHFWHSGGIMDAAVIAWQYKPEPYKKGGAGNDT